MAQPGGFGGEATAVCPGGRADRETGGGATSKESVVNLAVMSSRQVAPSSVRSDECGVNMVVHEDGEQEPMGFIEIVATVGSVLLLILTLPFSLFISYKVVQEYERAVIFRLGRLRRGGARGPGIFFILPCIDTYCKVDLRTVSFDVPPQEVLSRDSVTVSVDAAVFYRVKSPSQATNNVQDYRITVDDANPSLLCKVLSKSWVLGADSGFGDCDCGCRGLLQSAEPSESNNLCEQLQISLEKSHNFSHSTRLLAATTLRNVLGTRNLSEILSEREAIAHTMQSSLDEATDPWGVKVERVEIKDVRLPVQLQRAMAAEAEAAREARAKVIAAEGEMKASRALKEASDVLTDSPAALQLRYLQTLNTISAEKNSTIVFPLPMDIITPFLGIKK
ncbi:Mechanosensory protein 2 [Gryllus bimaculatus]|nr:Mechanosensory protein 2 [Gryllus bimaculatus]